MYTSLAEYNSFSIRTRRERYTEHVTCRIDGGLGNQLFMIFTTLAYAMTHGKQAYFTRADKYGKRDAYWSTLLKGLEFYLSHPLPESSVYHEPHFHYSDIPDGVDTLVGYFQSYRYFKNEFTRIVTQIGVSKHRDRLSQRLVPNKHTVSLHFRIGDYMQYKEHHPVQDASYYERALTHLVLKEPCVV